MRYTMERCRNADRSVSAEFVKKKQHKPAYRDAVKETCMFSGGDQSFFSGVLLASSLSNALREIARGTQSHFFLYPIVIAGLLLTLWLIYLVFRFLIFRPIAKSQFASKSVHFNQIIESRILGSMASVVAVVAIDVAVDWLPNLDKELLLLRTGSSARCLL